jgi:Zn-dependent protease with chaperone function
VSDTRTAAYLLQPGEVTPGWVGLYAVTWALQWICAGFRTTISAGILTVANFIMGWNLPIHQLALLIGLGPLIISAATLVLPLGGWLFEQQSGGRRPSEREQIAFGYAFDQLTNADPSLRPPHRWFVTDEDESNACAYADTLMVTRGMLDNPFFAAVLAHELGHLNTSDSRLTAALYRITTPPRKPLGFPFNVLAYFATGRIAMVPVKTPWAMYWRHKEDLADQYAAKLGQGAALAAFLDTHALDGDLPTPFKAFGETSHPWTEHRIERLQQYAQSH